MFLHRIGSRIFILHGFERLEAFWRLPACKDILISLVIRSTTMAYELDSLLPDHEQGDHDDFSTGDSVRVHAKVVEGSRERIQVFEGIVIRKRRKGLVSNFTVRKISSGVGVERTFPLNSPRVEKIEVTRRGKVRRKNLLYLRGLTGRAARIKERRF